MEHMAAAQLLALLDVAKADAAFVSWGTLLTCSHNILQLLKLSDELSPLDQRQSFMAQSAQIVSNLAHDVDWQGASAHNKQEKSRIDQEVTRVKKKGDDVEDEFLLQPLLLVAKLKQGHLILEVGLDSLQEESSELQSNTRLSNTSRSTNFSLTSKPIIR